ncbi:hypothetical protein GMOD_00009821 [Pyrenophora seminiperda CCB06]|uniref:Uncharacterized protein n=1 Tax=Pyrenophora seminiperda CCB06 TaxID=1302712 RepID=A0A3M7ME76_9PLEO|nr:hypothetical protein GMOD_00009821 [Pyrenophora seminiperda CCB06]
MTDVDLYFVCIYITTFSYYVPCENPSPTRAIQPFRSLVVWALCPISARSPRLSRCIAPLRASYVEMDGALAASEISIHGLSSTMRRPRRQLSLPGVNVDGSLQGFKVSSIPTTK